MWAARDLILGGCLQDKHGTWCYLSGPSTFNFLRFSIFFPTEVELTTVPPSSIFTISPSVLFFPCASGEIYFILTHLCHIV